MQTLSLVQSLQSDIASEQASHFIVSRLAHYPINK